MVSVVIPIRDEVAHISACLESVVTQDYPKALTEVLVVDGMSRDASRSVVQRFMEQYPFIRLLDNPDHATTYALNIGVLASKGDVVLRVDGHCVIESGYISACVEALHRTGADNVGGGMRPEGEYYTQKAVACAMTSPFGVGTSRFHYSEEEIFVDTVYLGAYRRQVFEKIGLFDEEAHYGEDDELNYRLVKSGGKILLSPKIRSRYFPRPSLRALGRQYFNYGRGKVRTTKKHGRPPSLAQLAPGAFVFLLVGSLLMMGVSPVFWVFFVITSGGYSIAAVTASIASGARCGWFVVPALPVCFLTMHVSYGVGFLFGLLRLAAVGKVW
jgi:glycosyltransferase involved in cell wall biosynthesis